MSDALKNQLLKLFPEEIAEVQYGRHKWKIKRRPHLKEADAQFVEIYYWDRRNKVFYRVWIGKWKDRKLRGRFKINKHDDSFDFTPVAKKSVYDLTSFLVLVFQEEMK